MRKLFLRCLILISSFWLNACTTQEKPDTNYQQLIDYLQKSQDYILSEKVSTIFILTEQGCSGCNEAFAKLSVKYLNKPDCLFLVLTRGARLDISMFNKEQPNILHDALQNIDSPLFQKTKALSIKNKKVVKIVEIEATQIHAQLQAIETWIKK